MKAASSPKLSEIIDKHCPTWLFSKKMINSRGFLGIKIRTDYYFSVSHRMVHDVLSS